MYKKYYEQLLATLLRMNDYAKKKDVLRNHTNYGSATTLCQILCDMGHSVDTCVYGDDEYLVSAKLIVDGETKIEF